MARLKDQGYKCVDLGAGKSGVAERTASEL